MNNIAISLESILMYFLIINLITFCVMWYDKHEAKVGQWRISEKALFMFAICGGAIGGIAGMYTFHHKTKKWYFKYGFPVILVCQIALFIYAKTVLGF